MGPEEVLTSLGSSVLGFIGGDTSQRRQQEATRENMMLQHALNKNEMNHSMQLQRAQQEWLMNTQYQKNVAGMKNAGLNPATANGVSPAVPSGGTPSAGSSGPSAGMADYNLQAGVDTLLRAKQVDNETRIANAQERLLNSQKANTDADTAWKQFQNSPAYQSAMLKNINSDTLQKVWSAYKSQSDIKVNDQQIVESAKRIEEISSKVGLNDAMRDNFIQSTISMVTKLPHEVSVLEADSLCKRAAARASRAAARASDAQADLDERRYEYDIPWYEKQNLLEDSLGKQEGRKGQSISNERQEVQQQLENYFYEVKTKFNLDHRAYWEIVNFIINAISPMSGFAPSF